MALRTWNTTLAALALGAAAFVFPQPVEAQVRVELELILAVDASGSVSPDEFDLQVQGLAYAFRDAEVIAAIRDAGGIAVALMQWSSPGQQVLAVDWSVVSDATSAESVAQKIVAAGRIILGETAIDGAIRFAMAELATNTFSAGRRIIDVSGDGATNWGALPDGIRDRAIAAGITINGLAVANEQPDLGRYYREHVIGGPGAFVIIAADYGDFARAMRLKLIEEISGRPAADGRPKREGKRLARGQTPSTRTNTIVNGGNRWKAGEIARR